MAKRKKEESLEIEDLTNNLDIINKLDNLEELNITEVEAENDQRQKELQLLEEMEKEESSKNEKETIETKGVITSTIIEHKGKPKDDIVINKHRTKPKMPSSKSKKQKDSGVRSTLGLFFR